MISKGFHRAGAAAFLTENSRRKDRDSCGGCSIDDYDTLTENCLKEQIIPCAPQL